MQRGEAQRRPPEPLAARVHRLLICAALIAGLWGVRADIPSAPPLHFLGAAALYLMFGVPLALTGMAIAALAATLLGGEAPGTVPMAWIAGGLVPVSVAWSIDTLLKRVAPPNLFVYVFGAAFAGGGMSMLCAHVVAALLPGGSGLSLPLGLLMAFGEAFLTGMLITLFVVYRGNWVATFDDARYLNGR